MLAAASQDLERIVPGLPFWFNLTFLLPVLSRVASDRWDQGGLTQMKQCSERKEQLEGLLFARSDITSSPICIHSLLMSLWPLACSILATHTYTHTLLIPCWATGVCQTQKRFVSTFPWFTLTGREEDTALGTLDVLSLRSLGSPVGPLGQKLLPAAVGVELLLGLLLAWTSRPLVGPTRPCCSGFTFQDSTCLFATF